MTNRGSVVALFYRISTHTPLAGRDRVNRAAIRQGIGFLLTRPSQGVTVNRRTSKVLQRISTHTPLAGRDDYQPDSKDTGTISTHTPLAGRDRYILYYPPSLLPHLVSLQPSSLFQASFPRHFAHISQANLPRFSNHRRFAHTLHQTMKRIPQIIITPSGLYVFFAPTCSTFFSQLLPR